MKTELIIKTSAPLVTANFDVIKKDLEVTLQSYNLILTNETVTDGKSAAAQLNKMKAAIKLKEKEALETVMSPVDGFRDKVKELITLVDDAREKIVEQVKIYEEKTKDEIRAQLQDYRENRLDSEKLYDPFRTIEIEDLVLLGSQTKTGNLTKKVFETINGRVAENKAQQMEYERAGAERKAAEEARIAAEVERRAELNRQEEERKAKERADAEIARREEEIRAKEREDIEAQRAAANRLVTPYTPEEIEEHKSQADTSMLSCLKFKETKEEKYTYKTKQPLPAFTTKETREPTGIYHGLHGEKVEFYDELPSHDATTGEIHQIKSVSVYFEIKIDTQGAPAPDVAKFTREWITSISPEIGGEIQRIGVTQTDGRILWN